MTAMDPINVRYKFDTDFTFKGILNKTPKKWLQNKRDADDLDGLWRIHDNIYDLTNFIQWHPGGQFWLETTKGTDVTEAFEIHHVKSETAEKILKHLLIKPASKPRLSPLTFQNDGFYKTLKKKVQKCFNGIPKDNNKKFETFTDILLITTFILAMSTTTYCSLKFAFAAGFLSALTLTAAHNFIHKRNNVRMYYTDLLFIPSSDLRVIHVLSHHIFTNSVLDSQKVFQLPFINLFPGETSVIFKYVSWFYGAFLLWPLAFHTFIMMKLVEVYSAKNISINADVFLPIILPFMMTLSSNHSFLTTFILYNIIILVESFFFCLFLFTNGHNYRSISMQNMIRIQDENDNDWGLYQLNTLSDRIEKDDHQVLTLVTFGDHTLHHLFPTLDHNVLPHLYPVVADTLKQFDIEIRVMSERDMFFVYFKNIKKISINSSSLNVKSIKNE